MERRTDPCKEAGRNHVHCTFCDDLPRGEVVPLMPEGLRVAIKNEARDTDAPDPNGTAVVFEWLVARALPLAGAAHGNQTSQPETLW